MKYTEKYAKPSFGSGLMRVAFVLLCLLILSVYMMGGLLAKYSATGSGADDARVAKFDVQITGEATDLEVTCWDDNGSYAITVNNQSEVAVEYTISVESDEGLNAVLDSDTGTLPVGPAQNTHTLSFSVSDWSAVTKDMTGENDKTTLGFSVTVNVVQID